MKKRNILNSRQKLQVFSYIKQQIDITNNKCDSCKKAIEVFGLDLNVNALRHKYDVYHKNKGKERSNNQFTLSFEQGLVGFLEAWALCNRPLSRTLLLEHMRLTVTTKKWSGEGWIRKFIKRNQDILTLRAGKAIKSDRIRPTMRGDVNLFIEFMENNILDQTNQDYLFVNADETRLTITEQASTTKWIDTKRRTRANHFTPKRSKYASYIPFHFILLKGF